MTEHLPTFYLTQMARRHPGCWQEVDRWRADRGKGLPDWPQWCYLPTVGSYLILSGRGDKRVISAKAQVGEFTAFGALAAWRVTQGIYDIHPTVAAAISETPLDGALPVEVLYRMPEWCVYVRSAGLQFKGDPIEGFFAYLDWDVEYDHPALHLVVDCPPNLICLVPIALDCSGLEPGIAASQEEAHLTVQKYSEMTDVEMASEDRSFPPASTIAEHVAPLVNLVLYVCAENAEIRDRSETRERPANPRPTSTKKGPRIFPADHPTIWDVGSRLGAALETATQRIGEPQGGTHASPRPHVRRAHWHHFWTGPKPDQTIILRWLPPIPVNVDETNGLVPAVRPVGEGG